MKKKIRYKSSIKNILQLKLNPKYWWNGKCYLLFLLNRDRCCRFKLLCALKIMKNSKQAKSFYSLWDIKICKQNLFTPINCWDNAVCLHFPETHKMHRNYFLIIHFPHAINNQENRDRPIWLWEIRTIEQRIIGTYVMYVY